MAKKLTRKQAREVAKQSNLGRKNRTADINPDARPNNNDQIDRIAPHVADKPKH